MSEPISVTFHKNGGARVGDVSMDAAQLRSLLAAASSQGVLTRVLGDAPASVDALCAELLDAWKAGDPGRMLAAFGGLQECLMEHFGMVPAPQLLSDKVPPLKNLPAALRAGDTVVREFPLQAFNAQQEAGALAAEADRLEGQMQLGALLAGGAKRAQRNVAALAQRSAPKVKRLLEVVVPAEEKHPRLAQVAQPMHAYFEEPVALALGTRRVMARVREAAAAEATEQAYEAARSEARAELRAKLDDRFARFLADDE